MEFENLSTAEKIESLGMRATAIFATNNDEYATVTINPFRVLDSKTYFQVYFVMWDEDIRVRCDVTDNHLEEETNLDEALNKLNEFLVPFEQKMMAAVISEALEH